MRDYDIRHSLHNQFLAHYKQDGHSIVVDELGVCNGQSVIDVAVINGSLHAFEIKSDADTLVRLPKQVAHYNKVFDYATIVVNGKYVHRVASLVPYWWAIWLIYEKDGKILKTIVREGERNTNIDAFSVAQLLWREEALNLLVKLDLAKGMRTKRRWLLWQHLAENVPVDRLCEYTRQYLKERSAWKESKFTPSEEALTSLRSDDSGSL
ncbi:sce7726 family protein [Fibrella forsythiae]|uniref:Sce7726 family protein n=1 Tax=Fibrella forsythiae TaxID=2817061 RepID=A0ABS3JT82_9BACT|nr:sce7726 family protein [Fibrella forsythiae]MBO0953223.1 sce7726 family protein [Fibrella forsythiae]